MSIRRGEGIEAWLVHEGAEHVTVAADAGRATGIHAPMCPCDRAAGTRECWSKQGGATMPGRTHRCSRVSYCAGRARCGANVHGARLAQPAAHHGRDLRGRRHHRHHRAHHRHAALGGAEATDRHRKRRRRRRHDRCGARREVACRTATSSCWAMSAPTRRTRRSTRIRPTTPLTDFAPVGLLVDLPMLMVVAHDLPRQRSQGIHRLRQDEPGEDAVRLGRNRGADAPRLRAAQRRDGREHHACPLSRQRARRCRT